MQNNYYPIKGYKYKVINGNFKNCIVQCIDISKTNIFVLDKQSNLTEFVNSDDIILIKNEKPFFNFYELN